MMLNLQCRRAARLPSLWAPSATYHDFVPVQEEAGRIRSIGFMQLWKPTPRKLSFSHGYHAAHARRWSPSGFRLLAAVCPAVL